MHGLEPGRSGDDLDPAMGARGAMIPAGEEDAITVGVEKRVEGALVAVTEATFPRLAGCPIEQDAGRKIDQAFAVAASCGGRHDVFQRSGSERVVAVEPHDEEPFAISPQ